MISPLRGTVHPSPRDRSLELFRHVYFMHMRCTIGVENLNKAAKGQDFSPRCALTSTQDC